MPDTLQAILIGGIAGAVSSTITYFSTRAKIRLDLAAEYDKALQEAVDAPRIWLALSSGAAQLNFGLDHLITPLRTMGHVSSAFGGCADNVNRTPLPPLLNLGSTGSFGVDLADFGLSGGQDGARFPDATTVVIERT